MEEEEKIEIKEEEIKLKMKLEDDILKCDC